MYVAYLSIGGREEMIRTIVLALTRGRSRSINVNVAQVNKKIIKELTSVSPDMVRVGYLYELREYANSVQRVQH